jgi:sulfur transfer complex TusBCD TusB component (DsrH family)
MVVVAQSGPGAAAGDALRLSGVMQATGRPLTLVLLQDATLCAVAASHQPAARRLRELVASGATVQVLEEDLAMRGYGREALAPGCRPVTYDAVVDTLLADGQTVAGAF